MKNSQKYLYILLFSVVLLLVSFLCASATDVALPHFYIHSPYVDKTEDISIFDDKNGNYYVFLPSYANIEQVFISLPNNHRFIIDDSVLYDGMNCSLFKTEIPYKFIIDERTVATLWFYKSANVSTMYIDTSTGSMDHIHEDKTNDEYTSLKLYTSDGVLDFHDEYATLKGRGNATWNYDKRPYSLTLSSSGDLLDMGKATNWVLLANAYDESNLNNKLILDLASRVDLQWTPESRYVDLYLNGEYNGLYLLTEKIEIHENRLNIDLNSGDFLCKIDLESRWNTLRKPFLTKVGRTIEISSPEILEQHKQSEIQRLVNQMEQTLLSETDLQNSTIIDLDSWVRRYIIDEISSNIDSDLASSYFYYHNGVFFSGPVWDYDMVLGNSDRNQEANSFIAKNKKKSNIFISHYYSALYTNESFYNRMLYIYRTEFVPLLQDIIDNEIAEQSNLINKASKLNSIRWRSMFDTLQNHSQDTVHTQEGIREYLSHRIDFLNNAWVKNEKFYTVQFESTPGGAYWNISVPQGRCLETSHIDIINTVWINTQTGKVCDFSQPITSDMILSKQIKENDNINEPFVTRDYITLFSIVVFFTLIVAFTVLDIKQRRK